MMFYGWPYHEFSHWYLQMFCCSDPRWYAKLKLKGAFAKRHPVRPTTRSSGIYVQWIEMLWKVK